MNLILLLIREAGFQLEHLNTLQVNQKFDGLSNSPKAISIYLKEWQLVESIHQVSVSYMKKMYFYFMLFAHRLKLFNLLQLVKRYV